MTFLIGGSITKDIIDSEADKKTGNFRILNPSFIEENFGNIAWNADWQGAEGHNIKLPHDGQIRLTHEAEWQPDSNTDGLINGA